MGLLGSRFRRRRIRDEGIEGRVRCVYNQIVEKYTICYQHLMLLLDNVDV